MDAYKSLNYDSRASGRLGCISRLRPGPQGRLDRPLDRRDVGHVGGVDRRAGRVVERPGVAGDRAVVADGRIVADQRADEVLRNEPQASARAAS